MAETDVIRTPDQRVRVFVSSTLTELAAERQAVRDAVTRLRLVPVMFELGARPHPPRPVYRAYLTQSRSSVTAHAYRGSVALMWSRGGNRMENVWRAPRWDVAEMRGGKEPGPFGTERSWRLRR